MTNIALLQNGDTNYINKLYLSNKQVFLSFAYQHNINNDLAVDIYQDAVIALVENAKKGLLNNLQCTVETYLFSIGKYMIYKAIKKDKRNLEVPLLDEIAYTILWNDYEEEAKEHDVQQLKLSFKKLGEQCKKILHLFYYEQKNLDAITIQLGYENKDVVKSQKARCIKQLRTMMKPNYG